MFGGDDDDDFAPASSSKLASLFEFGKSSDGNTSLTYTAPKQPKKNRGETIKDQISGKTTPPPAKLSIIIVKAVFTYKLADGNYNAQGKLGAAILGNAASQVYQLLLYKGKQQHVTSTRISSTFQFVVQANNYATFYDDQMQNWSIMFENNQDAVEFAKEIGLARANAGSEQGDYNFVTQDLLFGVGTCANEGDSIEIRYTVCTLSAGKIEQEIENTMKLEKPRRVKLKKDSWEEGLIGVAKGCRRMIVLPPSRIGPWKANVSEGCGVVMEVLVGRIKSVMKSREGTPSLADSGDSAVDSSTDDTSIKARGASISEALSNSPKTHKASIISRMARMGQATLPLKGAVVCNPSDSEETEEELSGSGDTALASQSVKAPVKVRLTKSRPAASAAQEKPIQNVTMTTPVSGGILPHQIAVYQPLNVPWQQQTQQQFVSANGSMAYMQQQGQLYPLVAQQTVGSPQVFPVSPAAVSTPPAVPSPDSHLSIFLAEARTHNTEVRMGVAKVADKVDQVLLKLDTLQQQQHHRQSLPNLMGAMEPSSLLTSVQKIVNENEHLRSKLEEKKKRIDEQNEKIYQLLHSNQKYLEQSNNIMEQRQDAPLQTLILALQQEKLKLGADLNEALCRVNSLETQVDTAHSSTQEMSVQMKKDLESSNSITQEQERKLQSMQEELMTSRKYISELQDMKQGLEKKIQQEKVNYEERLNNMTETHQEEIKKLETSQQISSSTLQEDWSKKLTLRTDEIKSKYTEMIRGLQEENAALKSRVKEIESQRGSVGSDVMDEVKNVMNMVYHSLQVQFKPNISYDGQDIKQIMITTIRDVTLKCIEMKSQKENSSNEKIPAKQSAEPQVEDSESHQSSIVKTEEKDNVQKCVIETENEEKITKKVISAVKNEDNDKSFSNSTIKEETVQDLSSSPSVSVVPSDLVVKHEVIKLSKESSENSATNTQDRVMPKESTVPFGEDITYKTADNEIMNSPQVNQAKDKSKQNDKTEDNSFSLKKDSVLKECDKEDVESTKREKSTNETMSSNLEKQSIKEKDKQSRDSSLERSWRPQPPPPPLFDDEDDDDDWLS